MGWSRVLDSEVQTKEIIYHLQLLVVEQQYVSIEKDRCQYQ